MIKECFFINMALVAGDIDGKLIKYAITMVIVLIIIGIIYSWIKSLKRNIYNKLNNELSGFANSKLINETINNMKREEEARPRSLQGMDSIVVPNIMKDFPDFNVILAKTVVKDEMAKYLADKKINVHNVVITKYKSYGVQKVIIFQTSLEFEENGHKVQKRYDLDYTYVLNSDDGEARVAGNCPNCGAPLRSLSSQKCEYCNSILGDVQELAWKFTDIKES